MSIRKYGAALAGLSLFLTVTLSVAAVGYVLRAGGLIQDQLRAATALKADGFPLTSEVFDRHGEKIGEFAGEQRYYVALKDLPKPVIQAFLSAEDKDFYHHYGVSPWSALRALAANLRGGRLRQGASTITQQLARLFYLDQRKTWERKIKEALLAVAIERRLTKDDILEMYLNKIYLGNHSYGIEAAARNYFRKHAHQLSIAEAAVLAGLPKSPNAYAPHKHPEAATRRQWAVLKRMEEDGYLTAGEVELWAKETLEVADGPEDYSQGTAYVIQAVRAEITRKFEYKQLPHRGLRIYTTVDAGLQRAAAAELPASLHKSRVLAASSGGQHKQVQERGAIDGALISLSPKDGAILALQGGGDFGRSQFDRTVSTKRPLGALYLPVYVGLALERGYTLVSRVGDDPLGNPVSLAGGLSPTLLEVLRSGSTTAGAPLFTALGLGSVQDFARRLGFRFERGDLGLAFGTGQASPLQVATAYAAFANGGRLVTPHLIERITSATDQPIYQVETPVSGGGPEVLQPSTAFLVSEALRDVVAYGHGANAKGVSPSAGGMGAVTEDLHDSWYVGSLPTLVSVIWTGAERGRARLARQPEAALRQLAAAWAAYMHAAPQTYVQQAVLPLPPSNISFAKKPDSLPHGARSLPFLSGTEPKRAPTRRL